MVEDSLPVVVGVDGSAPAHDALRWAADEAGRRGRPLRIVHAVEPWSHAIRSTPRPW